MAAATRRPTEEDRLDAIDRLLYGLAQGQDAHELVASISDLHPPNNTFPGEVFLSVAALALDRCGDAAAPLSYIDLVTLHLPECRFQGRDNEKIRFAILAAAALRAGVVADIPEVTSWWGTRDNPYWRYSVFATTAIVRACAERSGTSVEAFVRDLREIIDQQDWVRR